MAEIKGETVEELYDLEEEKSIITVLKTMPAKIRKMEEAIFSLDIKKEELISVNKTIENDEMAKIRNEKIEVEKEIKVNKQGWTLEQKKDHKPKFEKVSVDKYTNEGTRELVLIRVLMNRKDYESNKQQIDKLDKSIGSNKIGLSYMKRILRSAEALVYAGK